MDIPQAYKTKKLPLTTTFASDLHNNDVMFVVRYEILYYVLLYFKKIRLVIFIFIINHSNNSF